MVNGGEYTIHGCYGSGNCQNHRPGLQFCSWEGVSHPMALVAEMTTFNWRITKYSTGDPRSVVFFVNDLLRGDLVDSAIYWSNPKYANLWKIHLPATLDQIKRVLGVVSAKDSDPKKKRKQTSETSRDLMILSANLPNSKPNNMYPLWRRAFNNNFRGSYFLTMAWNKTMHVDQALWIRMHCVHLLLERIIFMIIYVLTSLSRNCFFRKHKGHPAHKM